MSTLRTHTLMTHQPEGSWIKKIGWYGMAFFFIKGVLWLLIPFMMYAFN